MAILNGINCVWYSTEFGTCVAMFISGSSMLCRRFVSVTLGKPDAELNRSAP